MILRRGVCLWIQERGLAMKARSPQSVLVRASVLAVALCLTVVVGGAGRLTGGARAEVTVAAEAPPTPSAPHEFTFREEGYEYEFSKGGELEISTVRCDVLGGPGEGVRLAGLMYQERATVLGFQDGWVNVRAKTLTGQIVTGWVYGTYLRPVGSDIEPPRAAPGDRLLRIVTVLALVAVLVGIASAAYRMFHGWQTVWLLAAACLGIVSLLMVRAGSVAAATACAVVAVVLLMLGFRRGAERPSAETTQRERFRRFAFGGFLFGVSIFFVLGAVMTAVELWARATYVPVEATVVETGTREGKDSTTTYIKFTYTVEGQEYTSDRHGIIGSFLSAEEAQGLLREGRVTAYYPRKSPERAVLRLGPHFVEIMFMAAALLAYGFVFAARYYTRYVRRRLDLRLAGPAVQEGTVVRFREELPPDRQVICTFEAMGGWVWSGGIREGDGLRYVLSAHGQPDRQIRFSVVRADPQYLDDRYRTFEQHGAVRSKHVLVAGRRSLRLDGKIRDDQGRTVLTSAVFIPIANEAFLEASYVRDSAQPDRELDDCFSKVLETLDIGVHPMLGGRRDA